MRNQKQIKRTNSKFIIKDWAANTLQYNHKFNFGAHGTNTGSPMEFRSFDDAWSYIFEHYNEDEFDDFFVEELKRSKSWARDHLF